MGREFDISFGKEGVHHYKAQSVGRGLRPCDISTLQKLPSYYDFMRVFIRNVTQGIKVCRLMGLSLITDQM